MRPDVLRTHPTASVCRRSILPPLCTATRPPSVSGTAAKDSLLRCDLCSSRRSRHGPRPRRPAADDLDERERHRAFAFTRTGAGEDVPGVRRARRHLDMSDDEHRDDAPAARGAARAAPLDPEEQRASLFKVEHVPTDHDLKVCRVFTHMDIPALVYHLLRKLGLSLRFVLTRGPKGRALVTADQLALDDERERRWMAVNSAQREMLEAILYQRIEKLCESFTDSFKVFDAVGPDDPKCAQAVFEQLLTDFPLTHPGMHKQLLARTTSRKSWRSTARTSTI